MKYQIGMMLAVGLLVATAASANRVTGDQNMLELFKSDSKILNKAPKMYDSDVAKPVGTKSYAFDSMFYDSPLREKALESDVKAIFYDGLEYKGKPTRVFAYLGMPKVPAGTKVPGIVLVHGGGGTAFEAWVRLWNARGYAAIAMDNCGTVPEGEYGNWKAHDHSGPGCNDTFGNIELPAKDNWTYQAVATVMLANSLLRSLPGVDRNRIGVTGISWGGYLTCITAGVDSRFKYAVPVYGCGFLGDNSTWLDTFQGMGETNRAKWLSMWDPSVYVGHAKMPVLWVTGTNDFAYPMDSLRKTYRLLDGKATLCLRIAMPHGHGGAGERPEEIYAFAKTFSEKGLPLAKVKATQQDAKQAWSEYTSKSPIKIAELVYTKDTGKWPERKWESLPAKVDSKRVSAELPDGVKVFYFNLTDERGLIVSSEHLEL